LGDAGQDREQGEFAKFGLAEGGGKTDVVRDLFEGVPETEDRPGGGFGEGNGIEFAAEEAAQSGNTQEGRRRDVGKGAIFDLAVFAERLAEEDGGRREAVGSSRDVHAYRILRSISKINVIFTFYMTTLSGGITANSFQANDLLEKGELRSVGARRRSP